MKLNRKWLLLVALVLSVAMATTGTLAYLTDEDKDINTMTLGKVEIVQNEQERTEHGLDEFTQDKPLYPAVYAGEAPDASIPWADESKWPNPNEAWKVVEDNANVVDKFVTVTNTGKSDAYVRTIIAYEGDPINGTDIHIIQNSATSSNAEVAGEFAATEYIENVVIDGVRYDVIVYTYKNPLKPGETTIPSLKQIYMDKGCDNEDVEAYGEKYDVLVLSQAIQVNGFEEMGPVAALNDGFGEVNATNLAEWLAETEVGSPGDKWGDNNPPLRAEVNKMNPADAPIEDNISVNGDIPEELDCYYIFRTTDTYEEALESPYRYYNADFVVSFDKDIPANAGGLAGQYDFYSPEWLGFVATEPVKADSPIRLLKDVGALILQNDTGIAMNYAELCQYVQEFECGAFDYDDALAGTTMTVQLRLYETTGSGGVDKETGEYLVVGEYKHTFINNGNNVSGGVEVTP